MKINIESSVTVITPTIGKPELVDAINSVLNQTYKNIKHLIVIDGQEYVTKVLAATSHEQRSNDRVVMMALPFNTGGGGFYGHRVYAAFPHLINTEYICFLDEDNWYEPDHVKELIRTIETEKLDWAYSLRNIYDKDGTFIAQDNCESLGKWPIYWSLTEDVNPQHLIDTSSYCFKTDYLINVSQYWHYGWGGDRRFYHILKENLKHTNHDTSGKYTLNYRLDDNYEKKYGGKDFFAEGNKVTHDYYQDYPWQK